MKSGKKKTKVKKNLLLIRTHLLNELIFLFYEKFEFLSDFDVVFIVDNTNHTLNLNSLNFNYIEMTRAKLLKNNLLFEGVDKVGWRCGDYSLYLALIEKPEYEYYWMIEPDVLINVDNINEFMSSFNLVSTDLIATHLEKKKPDWFWFNMAQPFFDEVYGCYFSFLRISNKALTLCFEERQKLSKLFLERELDRSLWPNDESFVASFINSKKLSLKDFSNYINYSSDSWSQTCPLYDQLVLKNGKKNYLYHSVCGTDELKARLMRLIEERKYQQFKYCLSSYKGLVWSKKDHKHIRKRILRELSFLQFTEYYFSGTYFDKLVRFFARKLEFFLKK